MKKERSPEQKRKNELILNIFAGLLLVGLMVFAVFAIVSTIKDMGKISHYIYEEAQAAKNLTFPLNETTTNRAYITFNFSLLFGGSVIAMFFVMLIWTTNLGGRFLGEAWRVYKRRLTLEERVKALEKKLEGWHA